MEKLQELMYATPVQIVKGDMLSIHRQDAEIWGASSTALGLYTSSAITQQPYPDTHNDVIYTM